MNPLSRDKCGDEMATIAVETSNWIGLQETSIMSGDLRKQRAATGWTRKELALRSGLSESTIRNIEMGRHLPTGQTATAVALALSTFPFVSATDAGHREGRAAVEIPDAQLLRAFRGVGGYLASSLLLTEPACAAAFCAFRNRVDLKLERQVFSEATAAIARRFSRQTCDVWALGCADGQREIAFLEWMLAVGFRDVGLLLIEENQRLLNFAVEHTMKQLRAEPVSLRTGCVRLCDLPQFCPSGREKRQQLFCMFAPQFGLFDTEVVLLRQALAHARPRDLFLLGFDKAVGPVTQKDLIRAREPMLTDLATAEPLLLRLAEAAVRHALPTVEPSRVRAELDFAGCAVPSSYAIELRTEVRQKAGVSKQFSMWRSKRYEPRALDETLKEEGWSPVETWNNPSVSPRSGLHLYERIPRHDSCAGEGPDPGSFYGSRARSGLNDSLWKDTLSDSAKPCPSPHKSARPVTLCLFVDKVSCQAVARPLPSSRKAVVERFARLARLLLKTEP